MLSTTQRRQPGNVSPPFIGVFRNRTDTAPSDPRRARLFANLFPPAGDSAGSGNGSRPHYPFVNLHERCERRAVTAEPQPQPPALLDHPRREIDQFLDHRLDPAIKKEVGKR